MYVCLVCDKDLSSTVIRSDGALRVGNKQAYPSMIR